jgi:NADH:ubiquinone oxidoreductase subunit 5 (subunit L)/multisubunit Na+/H+ antiporter MnhA subunit
VTNETLLLLAVFIPIAGAFFLPLLKLAGAEVRNVAALCLVAASLACSLALIPSAMAGQPAMIGVALPYGFDFILRADGLAVFTAAMSSLISSIIVLYSTSYISHYEFQDEYYFMVVLFLGSMMGLVFSANLIWLYVFWELTAITSWRLIGFFREKQHVERADKAFLVTAFGALAMLAGFVILGVQHGAFPANAPPIFGFNLLALRGKEITALAAGLIMMGILSKSATLPFQTWLPDAGVAPSPVTALLHAAVLVKIGVYVYARLFVVTFDIAACGRTAVLVVAAASALISAGAALKETDLKRLIAYSTISQIAFIFFGFAAGGFGGKAAQIGVTGALLYILMHGLAKGGLFLCAGIVEQRTHTKDLRQLGGLARTMPFTAVAFLLCSFSVMGIPPFGGFFAKYMVFSAAAENGHLWIGLTFLVAAFMTIAYLFRAFTMVFLGEPKSSQATEGSPVMVGSVVGLAALSLAAGLFINPCAQFAQAAALQMLGR